MPYGIGTLPEGRRTRVLGSTPDGLLALFGQRTLAFDAGAASAYADLAVRARSAGNGRPLPDGYIAAVAAAHGFAVATRDTAPFAAAGLRVIDPWNADRVP